MGNGGKWHQVWKDCKSSCLKNHKTSASKWFWKYLREEEKGGCSHYCIRPRTHNKIIPHNTIFLPKLRNILSHTLHIMFLMHSQLHPLLIYNGVHQLHKIIHHPHTFIKILLEFLSVLDHNTKREMALKMSSLLLGRRMLACSKN